MKKMQIKINKVKMEAENECKSSPEFNLQEGIINSCQKLFRIS